MRTLEIGPDRLRVSCLGLGCMAMSGAYGPADEREGIATIQEALDSGVTLLDTGDFYGMGHNEMLIAESLRGRDRSQVTISVKFGGLRGPDGRWAGYDTRPEAAWNFLGYSLRRLKTEYIDIYRPARVDPAVPIEETVGALAEMVQAGYVRHIGLSEVGPRTIERANAVHPITDVQLEYSLFSRGIEDDALPTCRRLGIGVTAYGVLSRGLLGGSWRADRRAQAGDFRAVAPRFAAENVQQNLALVDQLRVLADTRGVGLARLATAWVAAQGADIVPLIGARRPTQLRDLLPAAADVLSAADLEAIAAAVPREQVSGTRYPSAAMADLGDE